MIVVSTAGDMTRTWPDLAKRQGWRLAKNDCGDDVQGVACFVR